ncbi:hypothetical protein JL_79 [Bacillus phage JL]|uniref:Uncharacterized protein n=1 Tax=Bacillus phage JL TaxID=1296655 RepID=V5TES1_9CAUD|nr:hypothetical protein AVV47_gp217 [Bacillus phage JL]AHB63468.1 hypothetical protein JL_79 [Bacillus phage JL]
MVVLNGGKGRLVSPIPLESLLHNIFPKALLDDGFDVRC